MINMIVVISVLGIGTFGVFEFNKIEKINESMNKSIICKENSVIEIKKENEELLKELEEYKNELKKRDSRIEELEEEVERWRGKGLSIPKIDSSKKTYMDYRKISKGSKQGGIVYSSEAWTDEDGLRRWGEYYCVALGSYYGDVGDKFIVTTDKGNNYSVIKADAKADIHTDFSNRYTIATGCMMEWIVETNKLNTYVKNSGNINNIEKVSGSIIKIIKIEG